MVSKKNQRFINSWNIISEALSVTVFFPPWLLFASMRLKTPLRNKKHIFMIAISCPRHKEEDSLQLSTCAHQSRSETQYTWDTIRDSVLSHRNHNNCKLWPRKKIERPSIFKRVAFSSYGLNLGLSVQHAACCWASCSALFFSMSMLKWSLQMLNK